MTLEDELSREEILALARKIKNWECLEFQGTTGRYQGKIGDCRIVVEPKSIVIESMAGPGYETTLPTCRMAVYLREEKYHLAAIEDLKEDVSQIYQKLCEKTLREKKAEEKNEEDLTRRIKREKLKEIKALLKKED